jgi:hypothetical protein
MTALASAQIIVALSKCQVTLTGAAPALDWALTGATSAF